MLVVRGVCFVVCCLFVVDVLLLFMCELCLLFVVWYMFRVVSLCCLFLVMRLVLLGVVSC